MSGDIIDAEMANVIFDLSEKEIVRLREKGKTNERYIEIADKMEQKVAIMKEMLAESGTFSIRELDERLVEIGL